MKLARCLSALELGMNKHFEQPQRRLEGEGGFGAKYKMEE